MNKNYFAGISTKLIVGSLDLGATAFSYLAALVAVTGQGPVQWWEQGVPGLGALLLLRVVAFVLLRTYSLIIRYIGEKDYQNVFAAVLISSLAFLGFNLLGWIAPIPPRYVALTAVDFFMATSILVGLRVFLRRLYDRLRRRKRSTTNVAIFGAGELGAMIERVLKHNDSHQYQVVAFFDDNPKVHLKLLNGVRIFNPERSFGEVIRKYDIKAVIIGISNLSAARRVAFIDACLAHSVKVLKMPPTEQWIQGSLQVGQLQAINYDDLLNRPPIKLDAAAIAAAVSGKVVLVTGCAGSIGSEIVRQLLHYGPRCIVGYDQAESPLAGITLELQAASTAGVFLPIIGSIREPDTLERIFQVHQPCYVFHAAAYKHVPIMEAFPEQAVKVNVEGTQNLAELALRYGVEKFVMISTDKVVNPSNVMGASKRIAEIYVQSLNFHPDNRTQFITTRFGNVLGSNGSVIPIFQNQIARREPITLTHPEVSRFFMTIPEACQLVLEAGVMGRGGEIFVFDMGEPVRIYDLAQRMILMAGLIPGKDIEIAITGLRPGEKLTEELLDDQEGILPTHHPKIRKATVRPVDYATVQPAIAALVAAANAGAVGAEIVQLMKALVPEFASQNSEFSVLDRNR